MKVRGNVSISQCPDPFIELTKSQNSFCARQRMGGGRTAIRLRSGSAMTGAGVAKTCDNIHLASWPEIHRSQ